MRKFWPCLYGIQSEAFIKVGVAQNVDVRLEQIRACNPHPCKVVMRYRHEQAYRVERWVHQILAEKAVGREWFLISVQDLREAMKLVKTDIAIWQASQDLWIASKAAIRGGTVESGKK